MNHKDRVKKALLEIRFGTPAHNEMIDIITALATGETISLHLLMDRAFNAYKTVAPCNMGCACPLHEEGLRKAHAELLSQTAIVPGAVCLHCPPGTCHGTMFHYSIDFPTEEQMDAG